MLTGREDLERLYSFNDFPVFMGCTNAPQTDDIKTSMCWWISRETGIIQLNPVISLDVLYGRSHGSGSVGQLWDQHHRQFAEFVASVSPKSVLEIGGGHGALSRHFHSNNQAEWTIIEPNPSPVEGVRAKYIKGFFDDAFRFNSPVDAVVHSHLFEHIYEPSVFMAHLAGFITEGNHLIFSVPNMRVMLERKYTNCINFEHTLYLADEYIDFLLSQHGFRLQRKQFFREDHSIFYSATRDSSVPPERLPKGMYERNRSLYLEFVRYYEKLVAELNALISETDEYVYIFGAHVFTQYLVAFGLNISRVRSILDNDVNKQGKRLTGTPLMVESPKVLKELPRALVILRSGAYNAEVRNDIVDNINSNIVFA